MDSVIEKVQTSMFQAIQAAKVSNASPLSIGTVSTGVRPQGSVGNDVVIINKQSTRAQAQGYTLHTFDMSVLVFSTNPATAAKGGDYISEWIATYPMELDGLFCRCTQSSVFFTDQDDYVCDLNVEVKYVDRSTELGGYAGGGAQDTTTSGGFGDGNVVEEGLDTPTFISFSPAPDVVADADIEPVSETQSTTQLLENLVFLGPNGNELPNAEIVAITIKWYANSGTGYTNGIAVTDSIPTSDSILLDFTSVTLNSDGSLEWGTNGPPTWDQLARFNITVKVRNYRDEGGNIDGFIPLNAYTIP
jgi:hypothetical protein